jgi:hypothetical protein
MQGIEDEVRGWKKSTGKGMISTSSKVKMVKGMISRFKGNLMLMHPHR